MERLTRRQREVVALVCYGFPNKEIGRCLNIQEGTVKVHLHIIYVKVGVSNRTALTRWGLESMTVPDMIALVGFFPDYSGGQSSYPSRMLHQVVRKGR
jgi:DNA-binding CsgD family transcriptional regulator